MRGRLMLLGFLLALPAFGAPDAGKAAPADEKKVEADAKPATPKAKYEPKTAIPLPKLSSDGGRGMRDLVIPIDGTIDLDRKSVV